MDKTTMKRTEVLGLHAAIRGMAELKVGQKCGYALGKTRRSVEPEVEAVQESNKPGDGMEEFNQGRIALCVEFAVKGDDGEAKEAGGSFVIPPEQQAAFNAKIAALRKEHKGALDAEEQRVKEFAAFLKAEVEVDVHKIQWEDLPEKLGSALIDGLMPILEGEPK